MFVFLGVYLDPFLVPPSARVYFLRFHGWNRNKMLPWRTWGNSWTCFMGIPYLNWMPVSLEAYGFMSHNSIIVDTLAIYQWYSSMKDEFPTRCVEEDASADQLKSLRFFGGSFGAVSPQAYHTVIAAGATVYLSLEVSFFATFLQKMLVA